MASKELKQQISDLIADRLEYGSMDVMCDEILATILAALQEPTEAMEFAVDPDDCPTPDAAVYTWRAMLNASALGEKAG